MGILIRDKRPMSHGLLAANMQMLCNIFPVLPLQLMMGSSFEQFLVLKKNVFFYYFFTIYGHDSQWSITI